MEIVLKSLNGCQQASIDHCIMDMSTRQRWYRIIIMKIVMLELETKFECLYICLLSRFRCPFKERKQHKPFKRGKELKVNI